uniref:Uncharacterized protein n=1 Tax=Anguilla anguilla TaxID=7936 RepID=A0A0E9UZJ3_ANGAN
MPLYFDCLLLVRLGRVSGNLVLGCHFGPGKVSSGVAGCQSGVRQSFKSDMREIAAFGVY